MAAFDHARSHRPGLQSTLGDDLSRMARAAEGMAVEIERGSLPLSRKAEVLAEMSAAAASLNRAARIVQQAARAPGSPSGVNQ